MKMTEQFVVMRNVKTGGFLTNYENNDNTLAFTASFKSEIQSALFVPIEHYKRQQDAFDKLAEIVESDVVVIEASYDLKFIDGESVPELTKEQKVKNMVNGMFEQVFGGE